MLKTFMKRMRAGAEPLALGYFLFAEMARADPSKGVGDPMTFVLTSPSFDDQGSIPRKQSCEGGEVTPSLSWSGAPGASKSFVLIVDDPDAPDPQAPKKTWVHWVLYDIPPTTTALPEGTTSKTLPPGTREGLNDW